MKLAAQQDIARAQYHLGMFYWDGNHGLEYDRVLAYMWVELAASSFLPKAVAKLKELKKDMSVSELNTANKLAAKWRAVKPKNIKDPFEASKAEGTCGTFGDRLNIEISDITKRTKEFLICLYKKDFYDDCKAPLLQMTAIYNHLRQTMEQEWWECQ